MLPHFGVGISLKGSLMLNRDQIASRRAALAVDARTIYQQFESGAITEQAFNKGMSRLEAEADKLDTSEETHMKAMRYASGASPAEHRGETFGGSMKAKGVRQKNLSPMDLPQKEIVNMFEAARRKMPYRVEMKAFTDAAGFKTSGSPIAEGAPYPSGLLPHVIQPELTLEKRYEPDRMADHIPTIQSDAPSWEYLVQSGNTNPAAVVTELGTIADIGIQMTTQTAVPVKIAALASVSTEALSDFSYFADWVPRVLSNAMINTETQQLVLGTGASGEYPGMTGFTNVSGVLSRGYNPTTDTSGIDTLMQAVTDIRVDTAVYGEADLIALHPATWDNLRRTKTTTDAFVLSIMDPAAIGNLDNLFGIPVITNTFIPEGVGVVLDTNLAARYYLRQALTVEVNPWGDTEWQTSSVSFRAELRATLAVLRPHAVNIVTGLDYDLYSS